MPVPCALQVEADKDPKWPPGVKSPRSTWAPLSNKSHLRYDLNMELKGLGGERLTRASGTSSQLPHQLAELYEQITLEKLPIP